VAWMQQRTTAEACAKAQSLSCPMSPMSAPNEVAGSKQLNVRGFFEHVEQAVVGTVKMPARPCHFSRTPIELDRPAPVLGEHNDLIYRGRLGYGTDELRELHESGVV